MSDEQRGDLDPGEREMTSADLTAHDGEHGELPDGAEPSQQSHHDAETEEDTASGGAPD
ncbi:MULTISPECIES: hypothetical protein [Leifsonia]|jgi:hypothetical protein|uniref:Uncharacterized protein n=3 Tax=Leifsonia TaxID=110932 RepID=U2T3T3_LEIAQ|nr:MULTISPECIES: hypothetical protein [Leifsonia]ERK72148.1 hypothetical protein N136_01500 [Leifsonia aquatica ATCC 14665]MBB2967477.1 hypothetical protein [Leifsonia aquatica]NYK09730.1 hypothetical protein [Leifsonia naganoensis]